MASQMLIFSKIDELKAFLNEMRQKGKIIGFVPTMGALHEGHLSLIAQSKNECDLTVCSIFVNPTQFNDPSDLDRYPRTPEKDGNYLNRAKCDVLFLPLETEMYPQREQVSFDFGHLSQVLEAKHRPGHFNGVAQVVKRFFEIIQPHKAYFGSKDYQQVMVVKALVKQMRFTIKIITCPIIRESDGLAMSSRNALLSSNERKVAALIPKLMKRAAEIAMQQDFNSAKNYIEQMVKEQEIMKLDYYAICDADTLHPTDHLNLNQPVISLIAVYVGKIRLIDNLLLTV